MPSRKPRRSQCIVFQSNDDSDTFIDKNFGGGEKRVMSNNDIIRCVWSLESTWKSVYGLGTQYVGYMTPDMVITILSARRYAYDFIEWDQEDSFTLENLNKLVEGINEFGLLTYTVPMFTENKDYRIAIPKLLKTVAEYDLSEESISSDEWANLIEYIKSK